MKCPVRGSEMVKETKPDSFSTYGLPKTHKENYYFVCNVCKNARRLYAFIMINRRIYRYYGKWEIIQFPAMKEKVIYT